jgi:hypothetical protein
LTSFSRIVFVISMMLKCSAWSTSLTFFIRSVFFLLSLQVIIIVMAATSGCFGHQPPLKSIGSCTVFKAHMSGILFHVLIVVQLVPNV